MAITSVYDMAELSRQYLEAFERLSAVAGALEARRGERDRQSAEIDRLAASKQAVLDEVRVLRDAIVALEE